MIDEIREISEMSKIVLSSLKVDFEDGFKVEGMPAPMNILLENDTLVPVIALYCNHVGNLLFNDSKIYTQKIYQTQQSLFYIKMEDKKIDENFVASHIKIILIKKFFDSIVNKNSQIDLTKLVNLWRMVFESREAESTISLGYSEDSLPLDSYELSKLFEDLEHYNI
jgi:hypothetical protein